MFSFRALVRLSLIVGALFVTTPLLHAQFRTSVQGTVTDPDGAIVPGATLTLKDNANNNTIVRTSDSAGVFNFNALPADHFTLTVQSPGFQQKVLTDLQFIPEQANSLNIQLGLGAVTTTVNVDASTVSTVDTETPNIGVTISANDIQHQPSFNRDAFTLTQLAPGVVSDGSQGSGGGVYATPGNQGPGGSGAGGSAPTENRPQANANGNQNQNNGIAIDGISTVSAVWGGSSVITPTEESIDNIRIVTNDYDAENARFAGAETLVTSKSGTNHFHGSAFIAIHRPGLNAYQRPVRDSSGAYVSTPQRDTQRFNQYGGSLGGPIIKDRLFAFFAYESSPNNSTATSTGWYETSAFRSAAPSGSIASKFLGFPGSAPAGTIITNGATCDAVGLEEGVNCATLPGQGLDVGSPIKGALGTQDLTATNTTLNPGLGNGLDGVADVAEYLTSTPSSSYYRQYNGRLDASVTSKDHLAFAIYWVPSGSNFYNGGARAYNAFHHTQINDAFSAIWNHTFSPTFLNEARANASGWRWNEITSNPQQPVGFPQDNIIDFAPSASVNQFGTSLGSVLNQWTYGYKDVATKVLGQHTIKFGVDDSNLHYLNEPNGRPSFNFYNIWDFLNDAPSTENGGFSSVTGLPGAARSDDRENIFGAFVQDDWKVRPNLTLHAGLRYAYYGALSAKQNNLPSARFGSGTAAYTGLTIETNRPLWTPQKGNFGPQLGFNWSPGSFNNKLVVRGGYGLNFQDEEIAISANSGNNPPTQNYVNYSFVSPSNPGTNGADIIYGISSSPTSLAGFAANPHAITSYTSNGLPTAGNANVILLGDGQGHMPTIYLQHFSLDTEYEISRELVASAGYEGSLGRHLINHETPNAPGVVAGLPLNPLITGGDYWTNQGSSNNNALLLELKHPFVHHFSADAQFQWAKSLDTDGSGPYYEDEYFPLGSGYSYGRSDFDIGKSLKIYGLWQPVIFHGNARWAEKIVGGWSLGGIFQYHTGFPFSPNFGLSQSLYCTQCGYYNLRPMYLGGGGNSHSNEAFINHSNYFPGNAVTNQQQTTATVNGATNTVVAYSNTFFAVPNFAPSITPTGGGFPSPDVALPPHPGADRNSFTGPSYHDFDASLAKNFGLPKMPLLGESAGLEIRADVFNLFNILNLNPGSVTNNIASANFGQDRSVLGARTITLQARFSF
ncbi:MAG TPA: TonB-dependent receptor [Acidobacteriaceae bacterium]